MTDADECGDCSAQISSEEDGTEDGGLRDQIKMAAMRAHQPITLMADSG